MEEGLEGLCCNRTDGDLAATLRITLSIAVQVLERLALDVQRFERRVLVPLGQARRLIVRAFGLGQNEPVGFQGEMCEGELFIPLGSVLGSYSPGTPACNRHAQRQGL